MKPSPFTYSRPSSLSEALGVLADAGDDGKVLAGGQSLVPILSMRLAAPAHLVDINRLPGLAYVRVEQTGVRVGALARHSDLERDGDAAAALPLLRRAVRLVAHPTIRNRGTTVGSITHADPAGEMPAVLALLGGSVEVARIGGTRTVAADEFFLGPLESAVAAGELATSVFFPFPPGGTGTAFVELARRHGDYAVCGVGATVTVDDDGRVESARTSYVSVSPTPLVLDLSDAVRGQAVGEADWPSAGRLAAGRTDPEGDIHATADYRRHLVDTLTVRALREAGTDAVRGASG